MRFSQRMSRNNFKLYVIAYFDPAALSTIAEQVEAISQFSTFDVELLNLYSTYSSIGMRVAEDRVFQPEASILIHPTVAYHAYNLRSLCESLNKADRRVFGPTILYKQDEHVRSFETATIIGSLI